MKKLVFLGAILLCVVSTYAQVNISHGPTFGFVLSKDFELSNDYGDEPKENIAQSGRFGYTGEVLVPLSREFLVGVTGTASAGANFRSISSITDPVYDESGYEIDEDKNFFAYIFELNFKVAPLLTYKYSPYRTPAYFTFSLAPITVATDFGVSAGNTESSSIYLGSAFEFGYFWTSGNQAKYTGAVFSLNGKWKHLNDIGSGFNNVDDYWGLNLSVSYRKTI